MPDFERRAAAESAYFEPWRFAEKHAEGSAGKLLHLGRFADLVNSFLKQENGPNHDR